MLTEYPQIDLIGKEFEQYGILWHVCGDFMHSLPQWMDGPFNLIHADEVVSNVDKWFRSAAKCTKLTIGESKIVAEDLKKRIEKFQVNKMLLLMYNLSILRRRYMQRELKKGELELMLH